VYVMLDSAGFSWGQVTGYGDGGIERLDSAKGREYLG
jgi:hypothetical protein